MKKGLDVFRPCFQMLDVSCHLQGSELWSLFPHFWDFERFLQPAHHQMKRIINMHQKTMVQFLHAIKPKGKFWRF